MATFGPPVTFDPMAIYDKARHDFDTGAIMAFGMEVGMDGQTFSARIGTFEELDALRGEIVSIKTTIAKVAGRIDENSSVIAGDLSLREEIRDALGTYDPQWIDTDADG